MNEPFRVYPPSEERTGVGYHCDICDKILIQYQYYYIKHIILTNPKQYYFNTFVCSEACATTYILSKI